MVWDVDGEERVAPRLRRALRSAEEEEGSPGPIAVDVTLLGRGGARWSDEQEEVPLRGRLRRALLAID
jgi:hypothetical protein